MLVAPTASQLSQTGKMTRVMVPLELDPGSALTSMSKSTIFYFLVVAHVFTHCIAVRKRTEVDGKKERSILITCSCCHSGCLDPCLATRFSDISREDVDGCTQSHHHLNKSCVGASCVSTIQEREDLHKSCGDG